jgi:hypothetical protein
MNMHQPGFSSTPVSQGGLLPGENVSMIGHGSWRTLNAEAPPDAGPETIRVALPTPFSISAGKVYPGLVGGLMPTINGEPLDDTTETVAVSGNFKVYFTLNYTVNYTETYLSSYTLDSVTVNTGASVPSDTDDTKYLQFNTVTGGVPEASYFDTSILVYLYDNGPNSTAFYYA